MMLAKKASVKKSSLNVSYSSELLTKLMAIFVGNLICAIGFNAFLIPNKLLSGGTTGLGIMVHYLTGLPTGLVIFIINIPIFIIGSKIIDKKFAIYSFISMMTLSVLFELTKGAYQYVQINDILIESMVGGIFIGIGMGTLFRNKVSQGGMDIIAAIFNKKYNMPVGRVLMSVNISIIAASSILFDIRSAMYTIIALYICYQIVDKFQQGLDTKKTVIIVSNKPEELADAIFKKIQRGATFLNGEGAYNKDNKKIIYCTVTSTQVGKIKELVDKIDDKAFITINDVKEVKGKGFKTVGF